MQTGRVKLDNQITSEFITEISHRLAENKRVRRTLPGGGRLHIDRNLPFLCIYRRPASANDNGTDQLITGEASYLVSSSAARYRKGLSSLVNAIVETLSRTAGAFLIIELWSDGTPVSILDPDNERTAPSFRIRVPRDRIPVKTIESIESSLRRTVVSKNRAKVDLVYTSKPWPEGLPGLLTLRDVSRYNCYLVGIEITPIYRDPETLQIFPYVLSRIQRYFSTAVKKGAFEFSQKQTTIRLPSYKALGRRAMVKAVWEVDQKLAEISNQFDFLLHITPVNIEQSLQKFKAGRFEKKPVFYYRPVSFDPSVLKRDLYAIPFDRIEDPTIANLFLQKMVELEMKISMIRDRNTRNFFYGSMQLFGEIDEETSGTAKGILEKVSPHSREAAGSIAVAADFFAQRARQEIERYRKIYPEIRSTVSVRDDIIGLMVSHGNLLIGSKVRIPDSRVEALIQHEVGTHVLTYVNGSNQPFQQLYCGLAGCDEMQEGLAVLSEYLVGGLSAPRFRLLAGRVIAAEMLIGGASFIETFRVLYRQYGFPQRTAYIITSRMYRSGGFTKDAVYLRGLIKLLAYVRNGGILETLYVGKISGEDIPIIHELQLRKVLRPLLLYPHYLNDESAMQRLSDLRKGKKIFNLV